MAVVATVQPRAFVMENVPGLEPQHEVLDLGCARFSDVSFRRDYAEAALLEDAARRNVVRRDAGVERPRPLKARLNHGIGAYFHPPCFPRLPMYREAPCPAA